MPIEQIYSNSQQKDSQKIKIKKVIQENDTVKTETYSNSTEDRSNSLLKFTVNSGNQPNMFNKDPYLNLREPIRQRQVDHQCACRENKYSGCYEDQCPCLKTDEYCSYFDCCLKCYQLKLKKLDLISDDSEDEENNQNNEDYQNNQSNEEVSHQNTPQNCIHQQVSLSVAHLQIKNFVQPEIPQYQKYYQKLNQKKKNLKKQNIKCLCKNNFCDKNYCNCFKNSQYCTIYCDCYHDKCQNFKVQSKNNFINKNLVSNEQNNQIISPVLSLMSSNMEFESIDLKQYTQQQK